MYACLNMLSDRRHARSKRKILIFHDFIHPHHSHAPNDEAQWFLSFQIAEQIHKKFCFFIDKIIATFRELFDDYNISKAMRMYLGFHVAGTTFIDVFFVLDSTNISMIKSILVNGPKEVVESASVITVQVRLEIGSFCLVSENLTS